MYNSIQYTWTKNFVVIPFKCPKINFDSALIMIYTNFRTTCSRLSAARGLVDGVTPGGLFDPTFRGSRKNSGVIFSMWWMVTVGKRHSICHLFTNTRRWVVPSPYLVQSLHFISWIYSPFTLLNKASNCSLNMPLQAIGWGRKEGGNVIFAPDRNLPVAIASN